MALEHVNTRFNSHKQGLQYLFISDIIYLFSCVQGVMINASTNLNQPHLQSCLFSKKNDKNLHSKFCKTKVLL